MFLAPLKQVSHIVFLGSLKFGNEVQIQQSISNSLCVDSATLNYKNEVLSNNNKILINKKLQIKEDEQERRKSKG